METLDLLALPERSIAEVWAKLDRVDAELYRRADPILRRAFDNGFSEPMPSSTGGGCALGMDLVRAWEAKTIFATRETDGGRVHRVVLDRYDFPELYVLKDESLRLRALVAYFQRTRLERP